MKKLHKKVCLHLEKKNQEVANKVNKGRKGIIFEPSDWVWVYFHKDRFSTHRKTKLMPKGHGLFQVLEGSMIVHNKIYIPSKYQFHNAFKFVTYPHFQCLPMMLC